jgi:death-on-curing protein
VTQQLTLYDLLALHRALIAVYGGMDGITEAGFTRLETAVHAPYQSAFGVALYPDLPAQAGTLTHAIIRGHPFSDGNKRVAVAALDLLLRKHGIELSADNDQLYEMAMAAAQGLSREQVIDWVRKYTPDTTAGLE